MLKSSLYDYSDAYILVKGTITVPSTSTKNTNANNVGKKVIFENCASNEPRFNGVYSRDKLPDKIKKGAYVINLDAFSDTVTLGFCGMYQTIMLLILRVLEFNIFQKEF